MKNPLITLLLFLMLIFIYSCSSRESKEVSTYTVLSSDFDNILTTEGLVEPIQSTNITCPMDVDGIVIRLVKDGTFVEAGDTVCVIEFKELQTEYEKILIELENAKADLNKTKANSDMQYALLEAQVKNNDAETKIAQMDSLQLAYATPSQKRIKELELEKVAINKKKLDQKLKSLAIIQQSEIRREEMRIQRTANRADFMKQKLEELTLKAPVAGLAIRAVHRMTGKKLQEGDPIWNGLPVLIIPELKKMKVIIQAPEKDYKAINVNDSVFYTFDAMPENSAWGKILKKAPIGQQYKEGSKVKFFEIEASIDSSLVLPDPGFTANCRVVLKQIKDTIVVPQIAIFEEDSMKVVYVKGEKKYEMRQILTGLSSPKEAIVTNGLKKKEIIALSKPPAASVKAKIVLPDSIIKTSKK